MSCCMFAVSMFEVVKINVLCLLNCLFVSFMH